MSYKINTKPISNFSLCYDLLSSDLEYCNYFKKIGWNYIQLKNQFLNNINFALGLFEEKALKGFVIGNLIDIDNKLEYEILLIYVNNNKRNLGHATKLLKDCELIFDKKLIKIYLEVAEDNQKAIKLYIKNQYEKDGIQKKYYNFNKNKLDAILFQKIINNKRYV